MENRCVICGEIIPEGRQVCPNCDAGKGEVMKKKEHDETFDQIELVQKGIDCERLNKCDECPYKINGKNCKAVLMHKAMHLLAEYETIYRLCLEKGYRWERL